MVDEAFDKETMCVFCAATNEYHTSSFVPVALQVGSGAVDAVAPVVAPCVGELQVAVLETVTGIAAAHSSFAGPEITQISNVL